MKWERRFRSDVEDLLTREPSPQERKRPPWLPLHVAAVYSGADLVASAANVDERHAEINCMRRMDTSRLKPNKAVRLYVCKISGSHSMSRPCRNCCLEIRRRLPCARVFYTDHDGTFCEDTRLDNDHVNLARKRAARGNVTHP